MFGTDLPSTRAKRPFEIAGIKLIQQYFDNLASEKFYMQRHRMIFWKIIKIIGKSKEQHQNNYREIVIIIGRTFKNSIIWVISLQCI